MEISIFYRDWIEKSKIMLDNTNRVILTSSHFFLVRNNWRVQNIVVRLNKIYNMKGYEA